MYCPSCTMLLITWVDCIFIFTCCCTFPTICRDLLLQCCWVEGGRACPFLIFGSTSLLSIKSDGAALSIFKFFIVCYTIFLRSSYMSPWWAPLDQGCYFGFLLLAGSDVSPPIMGLTRGHFNVVLCPDLRAFLLPTVPGPYFYSFLPVW